MSTFAPADFSERLVPRSARASQAPDRGAEAENASAAFQHYTESEFRVGAREEAAPAGLATPNPMPAGAVILSGASRFILRLIAAHDGRTEADVLARLIAAEGKAIGLSPLLAKAGQNLGDDLADLPNFARRAQNRFAGDAGTWEPDRNLRGLRR
ncbi:hypothetical protein P9279_21940 [Mesorhizobium sp. WSM4962]|uniref:hypothetical protein n=1 Tax=Mesorhizobium sp. WSM4962 TaxID=3038548 RepID=UPI0024171926|nr:hypothetical protein [Mesorhizobium sp. WSM4962]MDG4903174.1 hypothetical protein [Mesorhizobium sp. WSM4962]